MVYSCSIITVKFEKLKLVYSCSRILQSMKIRINKEITVVRNLTVFGFLCQGGLYNRVLGHIVVPVTFVAVQKDKVGRDRGLLR